ncbi:HlyD family type I secretion periplasmic adaptor subunit [Sphingomonas panacisoli]|uniref:Membrane fusion protein (MFP) family protein n=1 Tax=Sphingomonas panacisoli TaxID=1813879 RepID=A0A5B8LE68_9SPHN|nr:HlyD family type I secretion periplasmic adaptor subunit [Sphingomonas panacisoli]QDZ06427.1 HlyD family type I secretion periplasmic adaptor subunit [Sphingomonas panacisoli]
MNAITRNWQIVRDSLADDRCRKSSLLGTDQHDFLPAALEIIDTPVSPTGRITAWVLMIGLGVTVLWLVFGRIDVVASAPGKLIPVDRVKLIQPAEPGVVRAILVRDGERVKAGQALVQLDPTVSTAEATQAAKALETSLLDVARARAVLAVLDGGTLTFVAPPGTPGDIASTQAALARAELADIQATTSGNVAKRDAAASARDEARVQAAKLAETLPLLDEQISANEQLSAKGYVSKLKVIEMRRQRLGIARDRDAAIITARRSESDMAAAQSAIVQATSEARTRILGDLAKAESDARLRREEVAKATQKSSLQTLVSPVDGVIAQLAVHTVGGVVEAAKPIMIVVPVGGTVIADVKIPNRDIGFVRVGQGVALKLEAFPFTRYGALRGKVESIASDAVEDDKLGLVYPAQISIDAVQPGLRSGKLKAGVGMQITADIRTGQRSLLSYLISPIDEASQEAGRER